MMKLFAAKTLLLCLFVISLFACKDTPKSTAQKADTVQFEIPNTTEEVKEKFESGIHKSSVYFNKETKEKVAEVTFHENGQPYTNRKFQGEVMNGESWSYYKNGQPWSLNSFKDGIYHGKYKTWHENGQVNMEGQYVNGKEDGDWLTFYPNGQINTRGLYNMGEKVGVWSSYNEDGTLFRELDYSKK